MDHTAGRDELLAYLRYELVGPWESWDNGPAVVATGRELDTSGDLRFNDKEASYGPFVQSGNREEILQRDRPCKRYGVGVLYPVSVGLESELDREENVSSEAEVESTDHVEPLTADGEQNIRAIVERRNTQEPPDNDFDLSGANGFQASAMAVSFFAELPNDATLVVEARGGRYHRRKVTVAGKGRLWWLRSPVRMTAFFPAASLIGGTNRLVKPMNIDGNGSNADGFSFEITAFTRPREGKSSLVTVSLVNRCSSVSEGSDEHCLFQARFRVMIRCGDSLLPGFLPYPEQKRSEGSAIDTEDDSFDLLYRGMKTFAVGHGCAADWDGPAEKSVSEVRAEPLPIVETPSITPQIYLRNPDGSGKEVIVPMGPLAGLDPSDDGFAAMEEVVSLYEEWIADQRVLAASLEQRYKSVAARHLGDCERALSRMQKGLAFVRSGRARRAFQLANEAMLLQQLRTRRTARQTVLDGSRYRVPEPLDVPEWRTATERGAWRPFQIAFLLCAVESVADPDHVERETVDLIWFPTGGGKTEAYLGLSAFALFYRRLRDPMDSGVEVLMRYTLRLLTQQQFQRASSLTCAMEFIRRREQDLGDAEFSIGIWLGGESTPNTREEARHLLRQLNSGDSQAQNKFVILRCPWCSAAMGPVDVGAAIKVPRGVPRVIGYVEDRGTVNFRCPDAICDFAGRLPIFVIDQDIYEARPSIVIATVDKFALLAWNEDCRALFGIGPDGMRIASPPQTIIQDELHLISGPLGSLVGLYEGVIEQLCTDERGSHPRKPKIVSSTATIRRHEDQIRSLYAREDVALFPPRGINASDSFFAHFAEENDGSLSPGRMYVGVHAPGLGSTQTAQVRTFSALLQAPMGFGEDERRDPWWTLMVFFNSLRELGTSLSLLQSDIPDYLKVIRNRFNLKPMDVRRLNAVIELTGRLESHEVPKSMERLSMPFPGNAVDVCLASNVIEVGIDIDRLSLMTIVGQPKTVSQYIQVTGRIGRQWSSRPGLVVTIFGATKPRDRSHFEKFRSFHERLYAQVEPTSVTPYSSPVLDRALHAVLVSYVRQNGVMRTPPWPVPVELIERAYELLAGRVEIVDKDEVQSLKLFFQNRLSEWSTWQRHAWQSSGVNEDIPLLRRAGEYASPTAIHLSWPTPTSLRNVDAEARAEVSLRYVQGDTNV